MLKSKIFLTSNLLCRASFDQEQDDSRKQVIIKLAKQLAKFP